MRFTKVILTLLLATLVIAGARARAQANVSENEPITIYVNGQTGSDSASGTSSSPLKTIQAAVNKADSNIKKSIGTRVIVDAGVYREDVVIPAISQSAPMTIEAATTGAAVIAGSDVLTNWYQSSGSIYSHSWSYNFGNCAVPSGWPSPFAAVALRTEMIFVNSKPLTQVMAYSQLRAGTFFVNEAYNVLYVWPPAGTDMYTALVEASVRPETLSMQGRRNIVLRGLVFRHARSCINDSGANITGSTNLLIDRVQAVWNNWGGIAVSSSNDVTVQNSVASYNGGVGISGRTIQNALFKFNESDYNNWRGAQAALYDWGMGGTKLMLMRNTTVEDHYSFRNQAQGLWFDTDNKDITINGVNLSQNVLSSLQLEASEGPITLEYSKLCDSGVGVTVVNTENLTVKDNTFYNNGGTNKYQGEIFLGGNPGGRVIYDWLTGEYYDLFTSGTVLSGNTFEDASAGQNVFGTFLSGYDWSHFADTVSGSDNKWHDPTTTYSFKIADGKLVNLAGWRSVTGTDYSSIWGLPSSSPAGGCSVPTPSYTDFSVNVDSDDYAMISGRAVATARVNSFGFGTVNLSVSGLPAGVSASLSRQSLVSGVVTLTMTASKSAATQNVPITLWAYDSIRAHSVTFYVHVAP